MDTARNCCYCNKPYERDGFLKRHQAICKATHTPNPLSITDMNTIVRELLKRVDRLEADNIRLKARLASKRSNLCEWLEHHVRVDTYFAPQSLTLSVMHDDLMKLLHGDTEGSIKDVLDRQSWDYFKCTDVETMKMYCFKEEGWRVVESKDMQVIAQLIIREMKRLFDHYVDEQLEDDSYLDYMEKLYKLKADKIGIIVKKNLSSISFISTDIA